MIRVLQVFDSLEISGGVQAVVVNTYRKIDKSAVQFDFAVYDAPTENSYQPEIESMGGQVIPMQGLGAAGILGFYRQFRQLFREKKYDAVHAHNLHHNGLILLAAKQAGIPIRISHGHQSYDERNASFSRRMMANGLKWLNNRVATQRVACSDLAAEFLYGKGREYQFLPNAIDISRYEQLPSKHDLRQKNGFSDAQKLIIHIGRFTPPKNQFFLVNIMEQLRGKNCCLLIAGDGPLKEEVLGAFHEAGLDDSVRFLGLRSDVPELLAMSDCMVLPSIYEGLPMVAVEAQAAGCPSFLSDCITRQADLQVGLIEYLKLDSAKEWAERIEEVSKRQSSVSAELVHQKIRENKFDVQTNLEAWYQLYGAEKPIRSQRNCSDLSG